MRSHTPSGAALPRVCEHRRRLAHLPHLGPGFGMIGEVGLDAPAVDVVDRVEGVGTEQLVEMVVGRHVPTSTPAATSSRCSRRSPLRILLFTVPSGTSRRAATSR